ncbi:PVC-type heme-binding CxxCH protein [Schlesneria sp. DSM 10557]|uniref:PVC-type heme-binding CxxCH protein n=1 Tax=Schlesneria sp. DSM 10557 TaxID=3044399 RepID=UPI0035A137EE
MSYRFGFLLLSICGVLPLAAADPQQMKSPLSTDDSLGSFVLASPDLKVELVAGEPEVIDPVAIAFGADGSMWVVEMRDYPYGPKPGTDEKPKSRIKRLFDHNHDGRYETATVFADELLFATGLLPWKDGIIVTLAGEIAFFTDRDGDGKAEFKETWFQGFSQENSQLRANHPTLGPDGYIYVANGLRGGTIVPTKPEWRDKGAPLPLAGFDFRFNPLTGDYGAVSGHGQFGLCFDDYGNRFVCSNRNPVQHIVLEDHYTKRNPFFAVRSTVQDVAAFGEHSKLYPISQAWTTSTLHANQFTAACGVTIYRGDGLPPEYKGNSFTCDPTANLVHRETLVPSGASFISHPSDGQREFLASPDTWFRPVNLANGPDGALYIVDMYRAVIEHPDWMPNELRTRKDLHDGNDRGRIWRVKSEESVMPQDRPEQALDKLPVPQLVKLLDHANSWHRETATRLLLEQDRDAVLEALKQNWKQNRLTRSRLPVLWLMKILDPRLTPPVIAWSDIDNRDPRVREQVVSAIGDRLEELLPEEIIQLTTEETDDRVRFRLALDLSGGVEQQPNRRKALVRLLDRGAEDPWLRAAIGTTFSEPPQALLLELLDHWMTLPQPPKGGAELTEQLCEVAGAQIEPVQSRAILGKLMDFTREKAAEGGLDLAAAGVQGLGRGLLRRGVGFPALRADLTEGEKAGFRDFMAAIQRIAQDPNGPEARRLMAIRTMAYGEGAELVSALMELALSGTEVPVRLAAIDVLATMPDRSISDEMMAAFDSQTPSIRRAILDLMLAQEGRTEQLLGLLEREELKLSELDPTRQDRLTRHRNKDLSSRAARIFSSAIAPDRAAVIATYQPVLEMKGDAFKGRAVFEKNCVTCHRVDNMGINVGPDIGDTRDKLPEYLLLNILDPNRAVDANYFSYTLVTNQGKVFTGLIKAETAGSITMRLPEGKEETILRSDVDELRTTGQSLMPVGFEKTISVEQMADLISFLKNWRYLDGEIPLQ